MSRLFTFLLIVFAYSFSALAADPPRMSDFRKAGKILHSQDPKYPTDRGWIKTTKVMQDLDIFDNAVSRMLSVFCSTDTNKSVLLVGEPSTTFKYYFARLAKIATPEGCEKISHVQIDTAKIQGHIYVGTTEKNWQEIIERPAYDKAVVIYFNNLARLIGMGTSSNKSTGIEATYVDAFTSGKLQTVAFINKYDYNRFSRSQHSYVLNSFQETIHIEPVTMEKVDRLVYRHLKVHAPGVTLSPDLAQYMYRNIQYYQPNLEEPQRTMSVLEALLREKQLVETNTHQMEISTPDPYPAKANLKWEIHIPQAAQLEVVFDYFATEINRDQLEIKDAYGNVLAQLSGYGVKRSHIFETDHLFLHFTSDLSTARKGFKISSVKSETPKPITLTYDDVRLAIMTVAQIPRWVIEKDFRLIRELKRKLDEDVVGVHEGKKAVMKAIKIGYAAGRTDEKPAGSLLLVGPTGTGKTYIARKTAEFMEMKLITLDMTQYASEESFDRFLDTVANYLVLYPYAVYLFEEIDKASVHILDRLYFMLDEGIFYDKSQRPLFARGAMIMMTTNTAHGVIVKNKNNPDLRKLVNQALQEKYRPSFLNRFDSIPIFLPFSLDEFKQLARIMVKKKIRKLKEGFNWNMSVDAATIEFLGTHGGSDLYGARPMERLIDNVLSYGISEYQIMVGNIEFNDNIKIEKSNASPNSFQISVNESNPLVYEVDLENNGGLRRHSDLGQKVLEHLQKHPLL